MKKIDIKLWIDFKNFFSKIKPKSSKKITLKTINVLWDIIYGLIKWQKCFLNTIVENMEHYSSNLKKYKQWNKNKELSKIAQIDKISNYLNIDLSKIIQNFLIYIFLKIDIKSFDELKNKPIKERILKQWLLLHDTTDIQKPFAKKMEKVSQARDWSKHKSWKWYYIEWVILYINWKIIPLILTLFSSKEESDAKKITRKNIDSIKKLNSIQKLINIFDRWYDAVSFIKEMIVREEKFIIRWIKNRWIINPEYYEQIKHKWTTQMSRQNIFSSVEDFTKEMEFKRLDTHKHYDIAFKSIFKKWENADEDINDFILVNLVVIRLKKDSTIKWIEEDLQTFKTDWDKFEKEFYFYTNLNIENIQDALVVFYLYLKRWQIETWFKYLKQVFWLEKLKIISYKKLKNICNLLVFSSYYLYDNFYKILEKNDTLTDNSLEAIEKLEEKEKYSLELFLLRYYFQYCKQKNLNFNPDSFSNFIFDETSFSVIYIDKNSKKKKLDTW